MNDVPTCECHSEPMFWHKDARSKAGGRWTCAINRREHDARWRANNREKVRAYNARYRSKDGYLERNRTSSARWRANNPEKVREDNARQVKVGSDYIGRIPPNVDLDAARAHLRAKIDAHRQQQDQERKVFNESLKAVA